MIIERSSIHPSSVLRPFIAIYDSEIGHNCVIDNFVEIRDAKIGNGCMICANVVIPPDVEIGDDVYIGPGVRFSNQLSPHSNGYGKRKRIHIQSNVSLGAGCIIYPGVTIGNGTVIHPGEVIIESVESYSVYESGRVL